MDYSLQNKTRKSILINILQATLGLIAFGVGLHFTIQANIGVFPWDVLNLGISKQTGIQYGNVSVMVSLCVVIIDLLLKEKIGFGTVIDALIVGKTVDFCNWIGLVKLQSNLYAGIGMMFVGLFIMGFSQFVYMRSGLSCGPRDALLVAMGKRFRKVPIGFVNVGIMAVVLAIGFVLGGPVGIGTLISVLCTGPIMQLAFTIVKFVPLDVEHQDIITSCRILMGKDLMGKE